MQLDNQNIGGETSYFWQVLDEPLGPADVLSSAVIQNPTITLRKEGTYLFSLTVNGTITSKIVAGIRELKSRTRIPAAGETVEADAVDGWATDVDAQLRLLLSGNADPMVVVGQNNGFLASGDPCFINGTTTIKTGLPGQEVVPLLDALDATMFEVVSYPALLCLGGVDGNLAPAPGALVRARSAGLFPTSLSGAIGDPVFIDDGGSLSLSSATSSAARRVGAVVSTGPNSVIYFDGRWSPSAGLDLADSSSIGTSTGLTNGVRLANDSGKLRVSENGAPYVDVIAAGGAAPANAPYLTNGAVVGLSAEINIQALLAQLVFIAAAIGGKVAIRRFNAGDLLNPKFEIQDEFGAALLEIRGNGDIVSSADIEAFDILATGSISSDNHVTANGRFIAAQAADIVADPANTITLDPTGNTAVVSGVLGPIQFITTTGWNDGSVIHLRFDAASIVSTIGGVPPINTAPIRMLNFTTVYNAIAGDMLSLVLCTMGAIQEWVAFALNGSLTYAKAFRSFGAINGDTTITAGTVLSGNTLSITSTGQIGGTLTQLAGQVGKRRATAANTTVTLTDHYIGVTDTSLARTITLPAVALAAIGQEFIIADESGLCSVNNIIVDGNAAELIDGSLTLVMVSNFDSVTLKNTGTFWKVI